MTPILTATDVWKTFEKGRLKVLSGVSLSLQAGQVAALWGSSGSGKSTLLQLLGGLDSADSGTIMVDGLSPLREADRLRLRREKVGFLFQFHHLLTGLTALENISLPGLAIGLSRAETTRRATALAVETGVAKLLGQPVENLSGGERQRVALCRSLIHEPRVLLADEPTGALDETSGGQVFALFGAMAKRRGLTVLFATHERRLAEASDRLFHMRDGRLAEVGSPAALGRSPVPIQ